MNHSVFLTNQFTKPITPLLLPQWHIVPGWEMNQLTEKHLCIAMASTVWDKLDADCLAQFPNLKTICHLGIGTDNIDKAYLAEHDIKLLSQPNAGIHDTAELALTLMLSLARKILPNHNYTRNNEWIERKPRFTGNHLFGKRLGLVGLGKIGATIASFAEAFKMNISYTTRTPKETPYAYYSNVKELAKNSDFLIICCASTSETYHLINEEVLENLGKKGYLINVARGSIVDQDALIHALSHEKIAGAGLDVFSNEPEVPLALRSLDNVVLSPHMGSSTHENLEAMFQLQAYQLNTYLKELSMMENTSIS
ncbi:NAD(P)-dependent oxidoreductase [Legionella shakespearei]|uniref:D-isomer specific 2-hydroxyacid dehydrogenase n=1 Tax=Legionella shakespearei DSM 23087 TaxID=1122169 RepID=A0A0W0Z1H9_9GAMM|nr:NAD(P)-dependent oxidoreductase [Legionella shakespearei]KTD62766.1 D-isomer specific 2-hydroxyacid dehydrogenase [Legionella shakespearei DSM 23087]